MEKSLFAIRGYDVNRGEDVLYFYDRERPQFYGLEKYGEVQVSSVFENLDELKANRQQLHHVDRVQAVDRSVITEDIFGLFKSPTVRHVDLDKWDVSGVKHLVSLFESCRNLESVRIGKWDVRNVETFGAMFYGCESLKTLNIGKWNMDPDVEYGTQQMFYRCTSLEKLVVPENIVSRLVEDEHDELKNCRNLKSINGRSLDKIRKECERGMKAGNLSPDEIAARAAAAIDEDGRRQDKKRGIGF